MTKARQRMAPVLLAGGTAAFLLLGPLDVGGIAADAQDGAGDSLRLGVWDLPPGRGNPFTGRSVLRSMPVEVDEATLQEISKRTGGEYFRATDADALAGIFETIDELEKTEREVRVRVLYSELFPWALLPGLVLLFCERLLTGTRLRRLP